MIAVRLRYLPPEAATNRIGLEEQPYWSLTDHLLDDLRMSLLAVHRVKRSAIKPHPTRAQKRRPTPAQNAARARKFAAARRRANAIKEG